MRFARWKALLVAVGLFAAGFASGASLTVLVVKRKIAAIAEAPPREVLGKLYRVTLEDEIHLTAAQGAEVERIVLEDQDEVASQLRRVEPALIEIRHRRHARIRALLAPEQQSRFDQLEEHYAKRRRQQLGLEP